MDIPFASYDSNKLRPIFRTAGVSGLTPQSRGYEMSRNSKNRFSRVFRKNLNMTNVKKFFDLVMVEILIRRSWFEPRWSNYVFASPIKVLFFEKLFFIVVIYTPIYLKMIFNLHMWLKKVDIRKMAFFAQIAVFVLTFYRVFITQNKKL